MDNKPGLSSVEFDRIRKSIYTHIVLIVCTCSYVRIYIGQEWFGFASLVLKIVRVDTIKLRAIQSSLMVINKHGYAVLIQIQYRAQGSQV